MTLAGGWLEPAEFPAWRRRVDAECVAGNLTAARKDALKAMLRFVGDAGLFPSDATIAAVVGCCARTVRRARADAQRLGLLTWEHTRKLVDGRWRQGPNHYAVQVPTRPVCPGGQRVPRGSKEVSKRPTGALTMALQLSPEQVQAAREGLARVRQTREAVHAAAWLARPRRVGAPPTPG